MVGLEAGAHTFNFAFQLPETGLYTSFDSKGSPAKVRYVIEVLTQYSDAEIVRGEGLVSVVCPEVLTIDRPFGKEGQAFIESKQISKNEHLSIQLTLQQTNFLPGDAIEGDIVIHNKTKRSIKYSHFNVMHKLSCFAKTPHFCQHNYEIKEHGIGLTGDKIRAGTSFSYPIQFYIPALVPQLNVPNCIYSEYEIRLAVGHIRNSPNAALLHISVPIKIGTQMTETFAPEMSIAPPAYDEILVQ
ncbi:Arrestin domain-containing protein 5 [Aphelenchoides bicaudatus]|nr:Arrestin domain-containing protein 5 [Aphelenchoides bicaudatus]